MDIYWRDLSESGQDKVMNAVSVPPEVVKNLVPLSIILIYLLNKK